MLCNFPFPSPKENIQQKSVSFTRALGVSFVSLPFPAPPLHLDVQVPARDKSLPSSQVTFRLYHKQLLFQNVWRIYGILKNILELIQYHFYKNIHHICFLVKLSRWEIKAWENSPEAGNTHGRVRWLNIIDLVHHGQKEHMDGHLGPNPDCPAFLRFSSGNNQSSSTYIVSSRILGFSLKNIGLFVYLFACSPTLLQGQGSRLFTSSLSPWHPWAGI